MPTLSLMKISELVSEVGVELGTLFTYLSCTTGGYSTTELCLQAAVRGS